jgi:CHAD domain-containing protein
LRRNADALARDFSRARRGDVGAVHRVRVATRRLRAALPLAVEAGRLNARDLARDLKRVTRALGDVREADVVRDLILDLAERHDWLPPVVARVERACVARRDERRTAMRDKLSDLRARALGKRVDDVADRLESGEPGARSVAVVFAAVRKRSRQLAVAIDVAGTVYGVEPLHKVRLATKKLRYALEAADGVLDRADDRARRRLKRFQERLGHIHDMQVAQRFVRATQNEPDVTPAISAQLEELDQALDVQCRQLHGQVLRERPAVITMLEDLSSAIEARLTPRRVGRMARMRTRRTMRRLEVGS